MVALYSEVSSFANDVTFSKKAKLGQWMDTWFVTDFRKSLGS